jgi:hypothetical protein
MNSYAKLISSSTVLSLMFLLNACSPEPSLIVAEKAPRSVEQRFGVSFGDIRAKHFKPPAIKEIDFPVPSDGAAIWGATGRNDAGNIYFGVSTYSKEQRTAYLFQYDPVSQSTVAQGDVLGQLKKLGMDRPGMGQSKLHSKFYQADDGYLYFSSFDESGETDEINPQWGGHLWRKLPDSKEWEHLLASDEALIAVNTTGRYVYALGYWGHVLYQYDTVSGAINRVKVGSIPGHISRNLVVDLQEHAYVPRVIINQFNQAEASLVEYDQQLQEVASYPMPAYRQDKMKDHHGIVAYAPMRNGDIYFTTSEGTLYQLIEKNSGPSKLQSHGYFHPEGEAYIASLFSPDGDGFLMGLSKRNANKDQPFNWLIRETKTAVNVVYPMPVGERSQLIYGSTTMDNSGAYYVVGVDMSDRNNHRPKLLKLN